MIDKKALLTELNNQFYHPNNGMDFEFIRDLVNLGLTKDDFRFVLTYGYDVRLESILENTNQSSLLYRTIATKEGKGLNSKTNLPYGVQLIRLINLLGLKVPNLE